MLTVEGDTKGLGAFQVANYIVCCFNMVRSCRVVVSGGDVSNCSNIGLCSNREPLKATSELLQLEIKLFCCFAENVCCGILSTR